MKKTFAKGFKKGFTLIELLVVIAIIGILSAIVLADLGSAKQKSGDAKVQEQLSGIRNAAELYFDSSGNSYGVTPDNTSCNVGVFGSPESGMTILVASTSYPAGTTVLCTASSTTYAVTASMSSTTGNAWWCVDSTGASKQEPDGNFTTDGVCE